MGLFALIGTAFVGLIVGILAKWFLPGRHPSGFFVTILIGVVGSFVARFIGREVFGWYNDGAAPGWIMSILGAMLLLWVFRLIKNNRAA